MNLAPGYKVLWLDQETSIEHKAEVQRVFKNKARIKLANWQTITVDLDDLELAPLPYPTIGQVQRAKLKAGDLVLDTIRPRKGTVLDVNETSAYIQWDSGWREWWLKDWVNLHPNSEELHPNSEELHPNSEELHPNSELHPNGWEEIKKIKGKEYRYYRWRENGVTRSRYLGKV